MSYEKKQIVPFVSMNSRRKKLSYKLKHHSPEYAAGFLSSATNILLTYPVNKLIFRQQIYRLKTVDAFQQLKNEGFLILISWYGITIITKNIFFKYYVWC